MMEKKVVFIGSPEEIAEGLMMCLGLLKAPTQNPEKLHTISQTAKLLGKSYSTICRMIKDKRIEATADGKYISQKSLDEYISAKVK